jgi:hypothetical protein
MGEAEAVVEKIHAAFGQNEYPGDGFLQGSFDGCEPYEEVGAFRGRHDWRGIEAAALDAHYAALFFFSEAGLRFFLPAYLVADLRGELETADPMFILVHGFDEVEVSHQTAAGVFVRKTGRREFVNPRRYGAATWLDHARWRLSVFCREEAQAIVAYLRYKRDSDPGGFQAGQIDAALDLYWQDRAERAPTAGSLEQHLVEEEAYLQAISLEAGGDR